MKDRNLGRQNQQEQSNERSSLNKGYEQTSTSQQQEQRGSKQPGLGRNSESSSEQPDTGNLERGRQRNTESV